MRPEKELSAQIFIKRRIVFKNFDVISLRNAADAGSRLALASGCLFYYVRIADTRRMHVVLLHVRKTDDFSILLIYC